MGGDGAVTVPDIHRTGLAIRLSMMRFGWGRSVTVLLCVAGLGGWLSAMPLLQAQIATRQQAVILAHQALQIVAAPAQPPTRPAAEERLARFYANLGDRRYAEQQIKTLFAIAGRMQLPLNQVEYKLGFDKNGGYYTYQIILPIEGSYGVIRQFCEEVLQTIPFASLDEVNFKRDAIVSRTLTARLRFTLYLAGEASSRTSVKFE